MDRPKRADEMLSDGDDETEAIDSGHERDASMIEQKAIYKDLRDRQTRHERFRFSMICTD